MTLCPHTAERRDTLTEWRDRPARRPAPRRTARAASPLILAAALALAACASQTPAPAPAPPPVADTAPALTPVPAPTVRPDAVRQAQLRRDRAADARAKAAQPPAPTATSQTMAGYLTGIEETLLARGLLRTDDGRALGPSTPAQLTEDFVQIALRDEYQMRNGRLIPHAHPAPLRRWAMPVRMAIEFGASVPPATRTRDRAMIGDFAARLGRITGHEITLTGGRGNFVVMILSEDERRAIGPRLSALIPGIPPSDLRAIETLSPQNYCTVFAYSPGSGAAYSNAVVVIRAELPSRLRLSCVHEELAQGMGLANDSPAARPSIFNDDEEFALLTRHDELLLKMLYDPRLRVGMSEAEARPIVATIAGELGR